MSVILDEIKASFKDGSYMTKIIYVNLAIFVFVNLISSFAFLFSANPPDIIDWLALPADLTKIITRPWTLITYMFLHEGFIHILFNLLWLFFGGRIFQDLLGEKRLLSLYILGGLSGGLLYILAYNIFPRFNEVLPIARALGASASVMAIIVGIATKVPNYTVNLIFIGNVKLKYIAIVFVALDLISLNDGNAGGHIAHIGGALFGFFYIRQLNQGKDWSIWFYKWTNTLGSLFKRTRKPKVKVVYNKKDGRTAKPQIRDDQAVVDGILDKISKSGYDSLTKEEKDILFKASQNN